MSIPPQLIRVKRKRDDDSPVTFLQLDEDTKRHRKNNWVYQRRESALPAANATAISRHDAKPVIHVSRPDDGVQPSPVAIASSTSPAVSVQALEQRKFHVSRAMLSQASSAKDAGPAGRGQVGFGPTVFVERNRKKMALEPSRQNIVALAAESESILREADEPAAETVGQRRLHRPGIANRSRDPSRDSCRDLPTRTPLPASLMNRHAEDMDKIAADMNEWVLNEIGANLQSDEQEKKRAQALKFRPKAPEKRYQERHPQLAEPAPAKDAGDTLMADASDEEGNEDEWIIEEYVRIPAHSMALDISPSDIGILVLDGEKESMLFYGSPQDEDEEFEEDDEDENAENHYTADYPEDEVDSDDEFDRHAYMFRNANASDDEEFDDDAYSEDSDEMLMEGEDDDDARMTRIQEFMKRSLARQ